MKAVLRYYWKMIKKRKWMFLVLCLVILFHASLETYWAIILERMANLLVQDFSTEILSDLHSIFFTFLFLWTIHLVSWRIFEWIIPYFQLGGMKELSDIATKRVMQKKYQYFQNEFSGSLVKKINRLSQNFENFTERRNLF